MGERSVTINRDAHGSAIFTGDISVQFGLASAPATYRSLIRRFLRAYVGSPEAPVPFGGRDAEIAELNGWLADPDAPSNLLVAAPAGRGKTALLVRWLNQVDSEAWPVVFVPISIRYETNRAAIFYQALAARLADILDEHFPPAPADPASFYRDKVVEYLDLFYGSERRCLIVIDGLDEAAGWQVDTSVLPLDPAPGLRIVASARLLAGDRGSADWLRRLGWRARRDLARTLEVSLLDRDGIADVIKKMGYPLVLSSQVNVLAELLRLTSGEPLLIEIYVTALSERGDQAARLCAEELRDLYPGFAGFFKDWWEQQRRVWRDAGTVPHEQMVQAILAVLACALGPLRLVELARLVREVHRVDEIFSADSLQPIGRFVIGDGLSVGYSFSHPKLADYFRDKHFGGGEVIRRTRAGFIKWGRTTVRALNEANLTPPESPEYPYLLEHYSQHWSDTSEAMADPSERAEALLELVSDGWRRAWEAYEGGFQGFAGDVKAAWDALRHARQSSDQQSVAYYLGAEIRCALCLSSICSLGTNVPADLLPLAVEWDAMSIRQAEYIAELKGGEPENRVQALLALAPHLHETKRLTLLEDIRVLLLDEENRSQALLQLSDCLASAEERHSILREARRLALRSQKPNAVAGILGSLLPLLPDDEDRMSVASKALEAANRVDDASARALLLADIALYLSPSDASAARAQAIEAAQSTTPATRRCRVLIELALRLPKEHPQKCSLGHDAIRIAELAISNSKKDANSQFYIQGATMARSRALALLASLERDPDKRNHILNDAESTARSAPDGYHQVEALTALIPLLPEPNRSQIFGDALRLACALPTGNNRTHALGKLVPLALPDRRREIVVEALKASRLIEDEFGRFLTLIGIAQRTRGHVSSDAIARARRVLDRVNYCIHRSHALAAISPFLAPHEQRNALAMALSFALMSPIPSFRNSALLRLVASLPRELQRIVIKRLMDDGSNDPFYALSLAHLVEKLPDDIRSAIIPEVLSRLEDSSLNAREEALLNLARFVKDRIRQQEIVDQIEIWIDGLESPSQRARYCAELANAERDISAAQRRSQGIDNDIDRIADNDERATVLVDIVVGCSEERRSRLIVKAYDAAKSCTSVVKKTHNLTRLAPYLGKANRAEGVALSFEAAKAVVQPNRRFEALRSIAPLLCGVQRQAAVDLLLDIFAQLGRSHSLSALGDLASILPEKYHAAVLLPAMAGLDEMAEWFP